MQNTITAIHIYSHSTPLNNLFSNQTRERPTIALKNTDKNIAIIVGVVGQYHKIIASSTRHNDNEHTHKRLFFRDFSYDIAID